MFLWIIGYFLIWLGCWVGLHPLNNPRAFVASMLWPFLIGLLIAEHAGPILRKYTKEAAP